MSKIKTSDNFETIPFMDFYGFRGYDEMRDVVEKLQKIPGFKFRLLQCGDGWDIHHDGGLDYTEETYISRELLDSMIEKCDNFYGKESSWIRFDFSYTLNGRNGWFSFDNSNSCKSLQNCCKRAEEKGECFYDDWKAGIEKTPEQRWDECLQNLQPFINCD